MVEQINRGNKQNIEIICGKVKYIRVKKYQAKYS